MTAGAVPPSFAKGVKLHNFAGDGKDDRDERHRCDAVGEGDQQGAAGRLHAVFLSLLAFAGDGRRADSDQGTLQVPYAAAGGQVRSEFRELLSLHGRRRQPEDVLSHPHQVHGLPAGRI